MTINSALLDCVLVLISTCRFLNEEGSRGSYRILDSCWAPHENGKAPESLVSTFNIRRVDFSQGQCTRFAIWRLQLALLADGKTLSFVHYLAPESSPRDASIYWKRPHVEEIYMRLARYSCQRGLPILAGISMRAIVFTVDEKKDNFFVTRKLGTGGR